MTQLIDTFGRRQETLRISVTDRCQMTCTYCLPHGSPPPLPRNSILTFEEIVEIAQVASELGVTRVRLTGGEPLLRKELYRLVAELSAIHGISTIALTTNGLLLEREIARLVESGLTQVSISIDSMIRDDFEGVTGMDALETVLNAVRSARAFPSLDVELNCVALRGTTEESLRSLIDFSREQSVPIRFIELMPFEGTEWDESRLLTGEEIQRMVRDIYGEGSFDEVPRSRSGAPARRFRFADRGGFGLIEPVSRPFCGACDRLRLSSDGMLYSCLFARAGYDLRTAVRAGNTGLVADLFRKATLEKGPGGMLDLSSQLDNPPRIMASIGG